MNFLKTLLAKAAELALMIMDPAGNMDDDE